MKIRLERKEDYFEVENLVREAFYNVYRPGCFEHFVIHNLRNDKSFIKELDYVLTIEDKIIGNIVYSLGTLKYDDGKTRKILTFGPVSILPLYQHMGYGEKLINYTMNKAYKLGYNEIVITGNPKYYKKYGFESASKYKIYYEGLDRNEESPFFMIKIFDKDRFDIQKSEYSDSECFNINEELLKKFDKKFPYKEIVKKDTWL